MSKFFNCFTKEKEKTKVANSNEMLPINPSNKTNELEERKAKEHHVRSSFLATGF